MFHCACRQMLIIKLNFSRLTSTYCGGGKGGKQEHKCICKDCWKSDAYTKLSILSLIQASNRSPEKNMSRTRMCWWYQRVLLTLKVIFLKQGGILECCRHQQISLRYISLVTLQFYKQNVPEMWKKFFFFCLLGSFYFLLSFCAS